MSKTNSLRDTDFFSMTVVILSQYICIAKHQVEHRKCTHLVIWQLHLHKDGRKDRKVISWPPVGPAKSESRGTAGPWVSPGGSDVLKMGNHCFRLRSRALGMRPALTALGPKCLLFGGASIAPSVKWEQQCSPPLAHKRNDSNSKCENHLQSQGKAHPLFLLAALLQVACGWWGRVRNFKLRDFNSI